MVLSAIVAVGVGLATGCGGGDSVPDDEIVEAVRLQEGSNGAAYTVGGDPFCEVNELLNDSDEVEAARDRDKLDLVITDSEQRVGIEGVPPFDPECARRARRALERIE
ncbi:MAG: hypothetical protein ACRDSN_02765 [Pseudonocardiaceae bacterium]